MVYFRKFELFWARLFEKRGRGQGVGLGIAEGAFKSFSGPFFVLFVVLGSVWELPNTQKGAFFIPGLLGIESFAVQGLGFRV